MLLTIFAILSKLFKYVESRLISSLYSIWSVVMSSMCIDEFSYLFKFTLDNNTEETSILFGSSVNKQNSNNVSVLSLVIRFAAENFFNPWMIYVPSHSQINVQSNNTLVLSLWNAISYERRQNLLVHARTWAELARNWRETVRRLNEHRALSWGPSVPVPVSREVILCHISRRMHEIVGRPKVSTREEHGAFECT